jgi:eukaryotic-like serine/threonine-protein kinase
MSYPEPGEVIDGKYKIEGYIGEGGMGAVARAMHLVRKAPVALKFMSPAVTNVSGSVDRFVNEAVAASALKSNHVVQVFDVGTLPTGAPYLVLELLDGQDAAQLVEKEPKGLDVPRAVHIVIQVLRALEVAHAAGIIHRDLKPSNCFLVSQDGDPEFVKLLDFGISKITREGEASLTQTNTALGTPLYMSPEQARSARNVDFRTDIYSAGVILYELLCGTPPHLSEGGEVTEVLFRLFTTEAPPITDLRPSLPAGLAAVVHKALARDPAARFASAREFAEALVPYCDDRSASEVAKLKASGAPTQTQAQPAEARVRIQSSPDFAATDATAATLVGTPSPPIVPVTAAVESRPSTSASVRTDLGSVHDAPTIERAPSKHAPLLFAAIGIAAVAAGAVYFAATASSKPQTPRADETTKVTVVAPPPTTTPQIPPSAAPSAAPSVVASAAPSATATQTPPHPPPSHGGTNTVQSRSLGWGNTPHN